MKSLLTLTDKDIFPQRATPEGIEWKDRLTGKVVLFDKSGNIALIGNRVNKYFLLPGGGIEDGEDVKTGTMRECHEETGCEIKITKELGFTNEYRSRDAKHTITHGFIGEVLSYGPQKLTEQEKSIGVYIKWLPLMEAMSIFESQKLLVLENKVDFYNTAFNMIRDLFFLELALNHGN